MLLTREDFERIPLRYRWFLKLLLKVPNPSLPYFVLRKLPEIEGVFWAIVAPIFLLLYFLFSVWLVAFLSVLVSFPYNILLGLIIPGIIFVLFLRIQLERTIHWWKSLQGQPKEWDVLRVTREIQELFERQQKRRGKT